MKVVLLQDVKGSGKKGSLWRFPTAMQEIFVSEKTCQRGKCSGNE